MTGSKVNFSQVKCREIAATNRLMLEMCDADTVLLTRLATIVLCDYDGRMRLHEFANEIMRGM